MNRAIAMVSALAASTVGAAAQSDQPLGQPHEWQVTLQDALSPLQEQIQWFNVYALFFVIPITILVAALLGWCIYRYREEKNPVPSRTSHNTTIEVIWTIAPVVVLLALAIPSFQLLTNQYNPPSDPELTVKATGYQWYWEYEYQPGTAAAEAEAEEAAAEGAAPVEPVSFASYPVLEADREAAGKTDENIYPRLLAVDSEMVVPVDTVIRLISTSGDVIHSFAMPALGVKVDAVPGRLNEYWFEATREGIYYGQCSELCGTAHYNMPIGMRVVSKEQFANWLETAAESGVSDANEQLMADIESGEAVSVAGR